MTPDLTLFEGDRTFLLRCQNYSGKNLRPLRPCSVACASDVSDSKFNMIPPSCLDHSSQQNISQTVWTLFSTWAKNKNTNTWLLSAFVPESNTLQLWQLINEQAFNYSATLIKVFFLIDPSSFVTFSYIWSAWICLWLLSRRFLLALAPVSSDGNVIPGRTCKFLPFLRRHVSNVGIVLLEFIRKGLM